MATTQITQDGKWYLFWKGWTTTAVWLTLYTNAGVQVGDRQAIQLTHTNGTAIMQPNASIIFPVPGGTQDVAYVELGTIDGVYYPFYKKTFPGDILYDFDTAGTLTVNTWPLTISGASLTALGIDTLCIAGLESIDKAALYNTYSQLFDEQAVIFESGVNGIFRPTNGDGVNLPIIFNVVSGVQSNNVATFIRLYAANNLLIEKTLNPTYSFPTSGKLTISTWPFTI